MTARAWGKPPTTGVIRASPEDFRVIERLGFEPTGSGEHLWLEVEKRAANTVFVAGELARHAGIRSGDVSFAGLKDRNAVSRQHFSLHLPGRPDPDWTGWDIGGVRILSGRRSERKIRRGRLAGNAFELVVRDLEGDRDELDGRLAIIRDHGVPNGFGEQRFGGNNIARAHRLFRGDLRRTPSKAKRGFYLSAARSLIFNRVLAERVTRGDWNRLIDGDLAMLDGSGSIFAADPADPEQVRRCRELDIHPTGPLVGAGDPPVSGAALTIEQAVCDREAELVSGLRKFRMEQQRRPLRLKVSGLEWSFPDPGCLQLRFSLPSGGYATAVLRELVRYNDLRGDPPEL